MYVLILIIHILVAFTLMAVVLMQSGKGKGLASAFGGGGGNQTLFGGRGAVDFLGKATWVLGAAFMTTSLVLAMLSGGSDRQVQESLFQREGATAPMSAPIEPPPPVSFPGGEGAAPIQQAPPTGTPPAAVPEGGN